MLGQTMTVQRIMVLMDVEMVSVAAETTKSWEAQLPKRSLNKALFPGKVALGGGVPLDSQKTILIME